MSESGPGSPDGKQPPPSRDSAGAQPGPAGTAAPEPRTPRTSQHRAGCARPDTTRPLRAALSPTGFCGRVKSASKAPPLPRRISPAVYETFLEGSDAVNGGKVPPGPTAPPA